MCPSVYWNTCVQLLITVHHMSESEDPYGSVTAILLINLTEETKKLKTSRSSQYCPSYPSWLVVLQAEVFPGCGGTSSAQWGSGVGSTMKGPLQELSQRAPIRAAARRRRIRGIWAPAGTALQPPPWSFHYAVAEGCKNHSHACPLELCSPRFNYLLWKDEMFVYLWFDRTCI